MIIRALLVLLTGLVWTGHALALPVEFFEPCVAEKTLVIKKRASKSSPAKPSPIIAWVTVRSGGPRDPDAPRCLDEFMVFDLPDPELVSFYPYVPPPELVETEDDAAESGLEFPPLRPRWPSHFMRWPPVHVAAYIPTPHGEPPTAVDPPGGSVPPIAVPEPSTAALFALALLGFVLARRRA